MSIAQLFKNPNQLTHSENLRIEEAVAGLDAEFENLRQRLRGQVEEADVDGAEYTALLMATTMGQIAVMQGAQRGDPKVISSMRQEGVSIAPAWFRLSLANEQRSERTVGYSPPSAFAPRPYEITVPRLMRHLHWLR